MAELRIKTDRLALREWLEGGARTLLPMERDAQVTEYLGPLSDAKARRIVTVWANARSRSLMGRHGMARRADLDPGHPAFPMDDPLHRHITYVAECPA